MNGEKKFRVMIADDAAFMHSVITAMLKDSEFEVVGQAKEGTAAVEVFEKVRPDILLLDIVMPGLTGPEILSRVLKLSPDTKVIMVSSLGTEDMVVECLRKGAKHFLQKPLQKEKLLAEMRRQQGIESAGVSSAAKTPAPADMSFTSIITGKRFFGEYLLEKHKITKEQLIQAVTYQKEINLSLEQICVQKNLLTDRDIVLIKAIQEKNLDKDVARIILDEGFLPEDKLRTALEEQKKNRIYIGEAMVKIGALMPHELEQELRSYKEEESREGETITEGLEKAKNQLIVKSYIDYTIKIMQRAMGETTKVLACVPSTKNFMLQDYTLLQEARGDLSIGFMLNLPESLMFRIASAMLNREITAVNDEVRDAVKEFINIIVGNSCAKLSNAGLKFVPLPPAFYDNKNGTAYAVKPEDEYLFVSLISNAGDFDVMVKM